MTTQQMVSRKALEMKRQPQDRGPALQFVNENAAAEILDVTTATLRNWRWRGGGPVFYKFGSAVRYEINELEAYARANRHTSTSTSAAA